MATKKTITSTKKSSTKKATINKPVEEVKEIKEVELEKSNDVYKLFEDEKKEKVKVKKHPLVNFTVIILLIFSILSFGFIVLDKSSSVMSLISSLLLTVFVICFTVVSITYKRNSKSMILIGSLLLIGYFVLGLINPSNTIISTSGVPNFSGKSVTEVMKWAKKNSITVNQEYEYSDMISEYLVISQDVKSGTKLDKVKELTVSVSEGANPSKEIIVPSMLGWDADRVLKFIKDNYLSNVKVSFEISDKARNTVINQSTSGNLKRDDELVLLFSYGEALEFEEITLIDFTDKSKFEVEFYMKQNSLNYSFNDDFSNKIKRGNAMKQSIAAGEKVKVNDVEVIVTISKGPEIKVPDLTKFDITKITEWAIENKVKLNFSDKYDDSVKENGVLSVNVNEGDIIEQGTVIKVVLSKGSLKMPKFDNLQEFYEWANKYEIKYEEVHEFSNDVEAGKVISYSYKEGQTIKNDDSIVVKISDGVKRVVPSVVGLTRSAAINKIENAGLNCDVVYRNSTDTKDKVLSQSIGAGNEVSKGTTVVIAVSNGKAPSNPTPTPQPQPQQQQRVETQPQQPQQQSKPKCENVTVWIEGYHMKSGDAAGTCNAIKNSYPKLKFSCSYVSTGEYVGYLINQGSIDGHTFSTCDTVTLKIRNQ